MSIAERIRLARRQAGLSQASLAEQLNVTRSACSQWEAEGGTVPRREHLARLAELCGVSYEWLATGHAPSGVAERDGVYRSGLSAEERELLERYERLSRRERNALMVLLRGLEGADGPGR